jgi:flagellin
MLAINTNVSSLVAQNNLQNTETAMNLSLQRLSSGLKINSGADNPAGLVISERYKAQIAGLQTAIDNSSKGASMVQTAEGALNEVNALLVQIRGLALDASNSAVNDSNVFAADQAEVANALATIDRIASNTQFGTKHLLDGSSGLTGSLTGTGSTTFVRATAQSQPGNYAINVTTAAQRAFVSATTPQTGNLSTNETLTINGVAVNLTAGESQAQVQTSINQVTSQTGVFAQNFAAGLKSNTTFVNKENLTSKAFNINNGNIVNINTNLTSLFNGNGLAANDLINVTMTYANGTNVNVTNFNVGSTGNTINDLLANINTTLGATNGSISLNSSGQLVLTTVTNGATNQLALSITSSNSSANTAFQALTGSANTTAGGGVNATSTTLLDSLGANGGAGNANYASSGDQLVINGTLANGTALPQYTFNVTSGSTINDVVNGLQAAFDAVAPGQYQASFNNGEFEVAVTGSALNNLTNNQLSFSIADASGNTGKTSWGTFTAAGDDVTRLISTQFGAAAGITVSSNLAASPTTSGFGTSLQTANGVDVAGTIGGAAANGTGNVLTGTASSNQGISVAITGLADAAKSLSSQGDFFVKGTGAVATSSTTLNNLAGTTTNYANGDTIQITGTRADGTSVSASFMVSTTNTLGDLTNAIQNAFGSANYTATFSNGRINLTDTATGSSPLNLTLSDGSSNTGVGNWGNNAFVAALGSPTTTIAGNAGSLQIADNSLVFQIGANAGQIAKIAINSAKTSALAVGVPGNQFTSLAQINVSSFQAAQSALAVIDQAINDVTNLRGQLGAFQSQTLESNSNSLQTTLVNTQSAEAVITNTDFAAETSNFTKDQVLMQAGTTVLSNANQTSQLVLTLLQHL